MGNAIMSMVPVALQALALVCLILAAFALKLPHVEAIGWLGLALYVGSILWIALRPILKL